MSGLILFNSSRLFSFISNSPSNLTEIFDFPDIDADTEKLFLANAFAIKAEA